MATFEYLIEPDGSINHRLFVKISPASLSSAPADLR